MADDWTPYGLENLRTGSLRKRRYVSLGVVAAIAVLWTAAMSGVDTTPETEILSGGSRNTIDLQVPDRPEQNGPDAVVTVAPGRIVRSDTGGETQQAASGTPRPSMPTIDAEPINWLGYLVRLGPYLLAGAVLWRGFRNPGKADEVNYGVYKGAMPLEMITASHAHLVVTSKEAKASLFGRRREDHVPPSAFLENASDGEATPADSGRESA